jgi:Family of unknown function (DUF6390)
MTQPLLFAPSAPEDLAPAQPPASGPVLFARYAYGPNRFGYCGPDDADELLEAGAAGQDRVLRALAQRFEGAYPYLTLIARSAGIPDPLDRRVVEAYWLGSDVLRSVPVSAFGASIDERFRGHVRPKDWRWLATKSIDGAKPVHAFHVLDVFPRVGLIRGGQVDGVLQVMDSCRIRWGRVLERIGDQLVVSATRLELLDGRLQHGQPAVERVEAWRDATGFIDMPGPGDVVSIHWSWACDRLDTRQLANLIAWTDRQLAIANRTI